MPVYNEAATVTQAIQAALAVEYPVDSVEIVVVNDGSVDGTSDLLTAWESHESVHVVTHPQNRGKGAALQTAIDHARGDYVAILDADLEYDPQDVVKLLGPLLTGDAGAVFGRRGFESHASYSFWYVVGNRFVTLAANVLFNSWLSDIMTCHKAMRADTFRALELKCNGFDIEPEITARLLANRYQIHEVEVSYAARGREEGKKLTALDGLRVIRTLLTIRVAPGTPMPPSPSRSVSGTPVSPPVHSSNGRHDEAAAPEQQSPPVV
jgi:glycosyltransferase involved in cell wall biosynthesis